MVRDVIVVGGGIAGLTAALSLAHKGRDVLLLEKNERCGGLMNSFVRDGFRFEGGARALVNAGLVKPMIQEFGLDIELLPNPITLGIEDRFLDIRGEESLYEYSALLKGLYPGSESEVDGIIRAIHDIVEDMKVLYGVDNPLFSKRRRNILALVPSVLAWAFRFLRTMYRISRMDTPFEEYLDSISSNRSLKDIIGQHFFRKTPVFFALSYFALYNDYIYPKGGVGALIQKLVDAIVERGGEVRVDTEITKIDPPAKAITDSAGNVYRYDKMIWAGDLKTLYTAISDAGFGDRRSFERRREQLLKHKGAESVFSVFLAVDLPPERFRETAGGHVFYTPDRRGLGDTHTSGLEGLLRRDSLRKEEVFEWLRRFCRLNTFEISIPALRDPDAAPPGRTGVIVSALFDYALTERIYEAGWYDEFKRRFEDEIISTISSSIYPGLEEKILFRFSASPLSIRSRVGSSEGSIVGWSFEEGIPVTNSMFRMADSVVTPLPDVFTAGKWVYSPAGGPTAIMTGRIAAARCLKR